MILEAFRQQPVWRASCPFGSEEQELVFCHGNVKGRAFVLPVRNKLVERLCVHDCAGQNMCSDLGPFLEHADTDFALPLCGELLEADGTGRPCRACPDVALVVFLCFALGLLHGSPVLISVLWQQKPRRPRAGRYMSTRIL